jgi:hypothetical protein
MFVHSIKNRQKEKGFLLLFLNGTLGASIAFFILFIGLVTNRRLHSMFLLIKNFVVYKLVNQIFFLNIEEYN